MTLLAIAHRAGNDLPSLQAALELGADVVEADVHVRAARLEVRHSKHLRPLPVLWDSGPGGLELTRTSPSSFDLAALLAVLDGRRPVMLDLKGPGRVGARVAELVRGRSPASPVLVCGRWWPGLSPFAGLPSARVVLTARTPPELQRLLRHVRRSAPPYGVSLHGSLLTSSVVARLREHVEVVMSWAVNDEERLRTVLDLGVNGIISDSHEVLRSVLAAR